MAKGARGKGSAPALTSLRANARDALLVAGVALASSLRGIGNDFALDDVTLIQLNERVHGLGALGDMFTKPYWPPPYSPDLYRPVASLLMALEYLVGAGGPVVFRVVSYLLYAAAAVALFGAASRLLSVRAALAVGVLFAAHPVHVEAVAQGVNQGELVVALIGGVMLMIYLDARDAGWPSPATWIRLGALYACAALTKENGFILPALLAAAELTLGGGKTLRERADRLWPGFAVLGVLGAALFGVRTLVLGGDVVGAYTADALVGLGAGGRALTMLSVVPTWLRLLAWPAHLQADYSPNEIVASTGWGAPELAGGALVVLASAVAWRARRRAPAVAFGVAACAIALVPVSNVLVPTSIVVAERTLFLPSFGFLLAAVALVAAAIPSLPVGAGRALSVAAALLAALGVARSAERHTAWRNSARLWEVTSRDAPRSLRVQRAHREAVEDLMTDFNLRISTAPEKWRVRNELALLLRAMGEDSLAMVQLRLSLSENPAQPELRALIPRADGTQPRRP